MQHWYETRKDAVSEELSLSEQARLQIARVMLLSPNSTAVPTRRIECCVFVEEVKSERDRSVDRCPVQLPGLNSEAFNQILVHMSTGERRHHNKIRDLGSPT